MVSRLILHGIRTGFMKILAYLLTLGKFILIIAWAYAVYGLVFLHKFIEEATFWCSCYNLKATVLRILGWDFSG